MVKEPLAVHFTQHEQPNCVFTVPQTTQNYDPAQLTQQCVYRNNPALLRVYGKSVLRPYYSTRNHIKVSI